MSGARKVAGDLMYMKIMIMETSRLANFILGFQVMCTVVYASHFYFSGDSNGSIVVMGEGSAGNSAIAVASHQNAGVSAPISITVQASGGVPLFYQWQSNGAAIPGATSDTLFIQAMTVADFATYTCVVTTQDGSVTSNAVTIRLDSDGDGLPDEWEMAQFGDLSRTGAQDSDGDGTSNEQEAADGTNANNAADARVGLTMLGLPGGTVAAAPAEARPVKGSTVTLSAVAAEGVFRGWTGSVSGSDNPLTLTMDGDKEVGAVFDEVITWGTRSIGGGGNVPPVGLRNVQRISLGGDNLAFSSGDQLAVWPNPNTGLRPGGVSGQGGGNLFLTDRTGRLTTTMQPMPAGLGPIVKVAAYAHAVALQQDGTVVCWGDSRGRRTQVPAGLSEIVDVAASEEGSLALRADGIVYAWGNFAPVPPPAINHSFRAIAAGKYHGVGLKRDGTVVTWGLDGNYDAGQYQNFPANLTDVVAISAGWNHSLALKRDGTVVAWGRSAEGQTAIPPVLTKAVAISAAEGLSGAVYAAPASLREPLVCTPVSALAVQGRPFFFDIMAKGSPTSYGAAGLPAGLTVNAATGAITGSPAESGSFRVSLSATNARGTGIEQLALTVVTPSPVYSLSYSPVPAGLAKVVSFDGGNGFGIAALEDGTVRVWGSNSSVQAIPAGLSGVTSVAAGNDFALALKADGTVVAWGANGAVDALPANLRNVVAVDAGHNHGVALRANGAVVGWGSGAIANAPSGFIRQVVSAGRYALGLRWDGLVHPWGQDVPGFAPANLSGVVRLAASPSHILALKADGTVVAWGQNGQGQLNVPATVTDAVDVAAGPEYSAALLRNGEVVRWGIVQGSTVEAPPGVALSSIGDETLMLTRQEPALAVPHFFTPRYLLAPAGYPFDARIAAQNSPHTLSASSLPPGLAFNGTTGLLTGTPLTTGAHTARLSAINNAGTAERELTLIAPGIVTFAAWSAAHGLPAGNGSTDTDGDGLADFAEYALGMDPRSSAGTAEFMQSLLSKDVNGSFTGLQFSRPALLTDVEYHIQETLDLLNWTTVAVVSSSGEIQDARASGLSSLSPETPLRDSISVSVSPTPAGRRYMRIAFVLRP